MKEFSAFWMSLPKHFRAAWYLAMTVMMMCFAVTIDHPLTACIAIVIAFLQGFSFAVVLKEFSP
jgi:hypothetical protein